MESICFEDRAKGGKIVQSSDHDAAKELAAAIFSPRSERTTDAGNIEESVLNLREGELLNYYEARALLGRMEYERGNVEAAVRVFDGIDIVGMLPKLKHSIAGCLKDHRAPVNGDLVPPMSMHAVSLLFEAILLKVRSLAHLGKFKEAAQSCGTILDVLQAAAPRGFSVSTSSDLKLQEVLSTAAELLPELWIQAGLPQAAVSAYRRALLGRWNLDPERAARIRKEFAVFLLYGGSEVDPPPPPAASYGSFLPRSSVEEALVLLMIQWRMIALKQIERDPSVLDHLAFALSVSGGLVGLAKLIDALLPSAMDRKERCFLLALCYAAEKDDYPAALDLLKKILSPREDPDCLEALLLASKICSEDSSRAEDGVSFARRAVEITSDDDPAAMGVAHLLLGVSLATHARSSSVSDADRAAKQREARAALEKAEKMTRGEDPRVLRHLCLEHAEQRRLDAALRYAKMLLRVEAGSDPKTWVLTARILSAQKRLVDAETAVNAGLDQVENGSQRQLLLTKARILAAQGRAKNAIETYTQLLALLHLSRGKPAAQESTGLPRQGAEEEEKKMEMAAWVDLANLYAGMAQWNDAELCLSKSWAVGTFSAPLWHAAGKIKQARGLHRQALEAYNNALAIDPSHAPSMVAAAVVLRKLGAQAPMVLTSYLSDALRLERTSHAAWFNLGMVRAAEGGGRSAAEAAECFQAAALLCESAAVEDFR